MATKHDSSTLPRLQALYRDRICGEMMQELNYSNPMQVPRLQKVVINMGVGDASNDRKKLTNAMEDLALIAGQQPVRTEAKRSVAAFKLREGMGIGCKVTLRGARMYEFLDRLINVALPRVRDFRGLSSKSFDGLGNYALGISEQTVFQEINYDNVNDVQGMDIVICTSASTDEEARVLLKKMNMPFAA